MEEPVGQISPYAYLFTVAFTIWMLIDAWRRRAPPHWYFIIMVMPIVYFIMIKLRDYRDGASRIASRAVDSTAFGFPASGSSLTASLDRADALEAREQYSEAEPLYRATLVADASNKRALHGLGRCLLGAGNATESLVHLEKLMELDREFANFGAALDYADALWAAHHKSDTIELLERLADVTGRINHRLALGHYLAEYGQVDRARREIERGLEEAAGPATPFNERQRQWVERGRKMLAELSESSSESPSDVN